MAATRVGFWYATGPADKEYRAGDPAFSLHTVISDESEYPGCVLVENGARQRFPVPLSLIDQVASPKGHVYSRTERKFVKMEKTDLA
jgi:hypothetical protein